MIHTFKSSFTDVTNFIYSPLVLTVGSNNVFHSMYHLIQYIVYCKLCKKDHNHFKHFDSTAGQRFFSAFFLINKILFDLLELLQKFNMK